MSTEKQQMFTKSSANDGHSRYLIALRPWSFTASFTPVALGSVLAYKAVGYFSLPVFITTLVTALSVHAAGNLVNTYYDYVRGIDTKQSDDRTLVDKILNPEEIQWLGMVLYSIGIGGFLLLCLLSPAKMEHLALIFFCGLSSSFLYTGGLGLKYIALGDIIIFLTFGPITVMFSFLTQAGELSIVTLLYAMPLALNIIAILHGNNTRDMESDNKAKIVTVAILLGWLGSYILFVVLLFLPYLLFVQGGLHISKWMFLPVITCKEAFNIERQFRAKQLNKVPQRVALLNFQMGILYVLACLLANKSDLPTLL
ncbi:ubiA prenyltransferase domain-containing protein 1 homolog isoform X2 [Ruditapes philippinarum]|uniref:ubiA prenyltransferase domain-containing protein 1 homolog isoform X2 n=1 Tax=Ruditapes philippinarum TaxID=129788 RepID=UPI00295C2088|nr:ubiA prenyltransferase domain-containing protein 1 homolog isoform X2 [Ruditapes philippinarum]